MIAIKIVKSPFYTAKKTYKPTPEDKSRSMEFANKVAPTVLPVYQDRAGEGEVVTLESVTHQCYYSKLSELAAMQFLIDNGFKVSEPDFDVYEVKDKDFSADLIATHPDLKGMSSLTVHIKSQKNDLVGYTYNTPSYAFTNKDELLHNPQENDFVLMIVVDDTDRYFNIVSMLPANLIFPKFIAPLKKESHKRSAIYWRHIKNAIDAGTFYV